jgi:hypothetical protein
MRALYLVPTRGRPANALRLIHAWTQLTSPRTRLQFILDEDDPERENYEKMFLDRSLDLDLFGWTVDERRRLGGTLNHYAPHLAQTADVIGFMGDDHVPRTHHWDNILMAFIASRMAHVVYGNDLVQGVNLPTAVMLDSRIVQTLGWMVPPGLVHMYMDNWWRDLGAALGSIRYEPLCVIEHMHPIAGQVPWDDRYVDANDGERWEQDRITYERFKSSGDFDRAVTRVKAALV